MARIAILTTFTKFDSWYSLTGIVKDQVRMLTEYGNDVFLFVNEKYAGDGAEFSDPNLTLLKAIPFAHLKDYQSRSEVSTEHLITADKTADVLVDLFKQHQIDTVFTHDFVFLGWSLPYALGIQKASRQLTGVSWLHWIHSIPSRFSDWWQMSDYGPHHRLIYPNATDRVRVAENYRATPAAVRTIPHIKDLRIMFRFSERTCELIDHIPALMQADVVQIYPASSDRFEAKRVAEVMKIFGAIKSMHNTVCLFVANQWATTAKHYANIREYEDLGRKYGLEPGIDLIFSSTFMPKDHSGKPPYEVGIPSEILVQLMQLSNLFVFPTREETFGLVLPEMALASGALCVVNRSLQMQLEISGYNAPFFDFGSYTQTHAVNDPDHYLTEVAKIIMSRMQDNESVMTRTFMRQRYNYDNLYAKFYAPLIAEMRLYV